MSTFHASDATVLTLIQSEPDIDTFVNDRSATTADIPFNVRRKIVHCIADLLDTRISRSAEKYEGFDLMVDSISKWLVVGTALWHPMFLCREYILAVTQAIAGANAENSFIRGTKLN
ncbi:hypothetical protein Q31b_05280 [Novipirellula aureliae]|uniref:Uncharacterized protein n=1 Tax=Novipirellula aureliae TaxID=2527966 RepID=A0A5C6ECT0_9BACT|nr:hypothetical protein [Novipirellula aureliae]TWU45356.1 hypothetical protein Q31b_05280 [Novipirellula aureliae]